MHAAGSVASENLRGRRRTLAALVGCVVVSLVVAGCYIFVPRSSLEFSPTTLPDGQVGQPYSVTITVNQAATPVFNAGIDQGALPDGLTMALSEQQENTIHIDGTPTAAGTFSFTISVACYGTNVAGQTGTQAYTIVVN